MNRLFKQIRNNDIKAVKRTLNNKYKLIKTLDINQRNCLAYALTLKNIDNYEIVKFLITNMGKSELLAKDFFNKSILDLAIENNKLEAVEYLKRLGINK